MRQTIGNHARQTGAGGPYYVWYFKGDRRSSNADSHSTLDFAKATITAKLAKPHNKGMRAEVWLRNRELVFSA